MRKTKSSTRSRLAAAGLATGAVTAAVFVAPGAAWAANVVTPSVGPASGTVTVTETAPTSAFTTATTFAVQLNTAACPVTAPAVSTSVFAAANATKDANSFSFVVPSTLALATGGVARTYNICLYASSTAGAAQIATSGTPTYTVSATSAVTPASGASGGGNSITVVAPTAAPYFTGVATPGAVFGTTACAGTYGTPNANVTGAVTKSTTAPNTTVTVAVPTNVLGTGTTAQPYNLCFYNGTGSTATLLASTAYSVSLPGVTLSSTIGSDQGGNGLTVSSTTNFLTGVNTVGALFTTATTCPTTYTAAQAYSSSQPGIVQAVSGGNSTARKLANNRLAVTVPILPLTASAPTVYQACFYNGTAIGTSTILAAAAYTSTTVPTPTGVSPNAGPALGGSTITVTGTGFPTTAGSITATLGGTALLQVTPVSSTAFTAVTPAHSVANDVALVVTTSAGSRVLQEAYSFTNALQVTPNTAPNTTPLIDVDVLGAGFLTETFTGPGNARVYLVDGVYNGVTNGTNKTNGPVADCSNVLVISDNELICSLQLNRRLDATGAALFDPVAYTNTITAGLTSTIGSRVLTVTTGGTFSANDVGQPIVEGTPGTNIPVGATITAVLSPTRALISAAALATAATFTGTIGANEVRSVTTNAIAASGSSTIAAAPGTFSSADVGRVISGTAGITAGTTITGVAAGGGSATLSAPTTASVASGATVDLYASAPVPNGAYNLTYVSNGDLDAPSTDPDFTQSAVSSSSTFTVAPF